MSCLRPRRRHANGSVSIIDRRIFWFTPIWWRILVVREIGPGKWSLSAMRVRPSAYSALNDAFRVLVEGAELLALAPNRTFKDADGKLSLDAGPFVTALEFASQKQALVLGKPSSAFFLSALASMNCPEAEAVMVGDDAETDVAGALRAGLAHALLVRTGKYRPGDEDRFSPGPTVTVDDIAAAADWIIAARNG